MSDQGVVYAAHVPERFQTLSQSQARASPDLYRDVRRPARGVQLKNETFATIRLFKGNGEVIPLVNAGSRDFADDYDAEGNAMRRPVVAFDGKVASNVYSNFFVQQVEDARMEKQQIVQTFGEAYIFLYGEQPRIINVSGVLLNSFDFNWEAEWWWNYENYLRGTKCVENDARVFLTVDDTLVSGYIIAATANKNAQERNWLPFQFQLFVTSWETFSRLGDPSADQEGIASVDDYRSKKQWSPTIIQDYYRGSKTAARITNWPVKDGRIDVNSMSFADEAQKALSEAQAQINKVQAYWSKVSTMVGELESSLSPSIVRIPYGWAGATALDENDPYFRIVSAESTQPVKFTTFGDNKDEYVAGGHYATSDASIAGTTFDFSAVGFMGETARIRASVEKARAEFNRWGLFPPNSELQATIALLHGIPFAGRIVSKAQKWAYKAVAQAGSVANTVTWGLSIPSALVGYAQNVTAIAQVFPATAEAAGVGVARTIRAAAAPLVESGRSGSAPPQG